MHTNYKHTWILIPSHYYITKNKKNRIHKNKSGFISHIHSKFKSSRTRSIIQNRIIAIQTSNFDKFKSKAQKGPNPNANKQQMI